MDTFEVVFEDLRSAIFFPLFLMALSLLSSLPTRAQVIAPSAQEMNYSYTAKFISTNDDTAENLATLHSTHLFGVLHSPTLVQKFGLSPEKMGGIGAPSSDSKIKILKVSQQLDNKVEIEYRLQGRILLQTRVAKLLAAKKTMELPLPSDLTKIYKVKCTDEHYQSLGDYWYFWDPYRAGCESLLRLPATSMVAISFDEVPTRKLETKARLDLLRGDNDNGELFLIYAIHGFEESSRDSTDAGRSNYNDFNESMKNRGFTKTVKSDSYTSPWIDWSQTITLANGKTVQAVVRSLLVNTTISSRSTTFAKFFKEAVEKADVIIYLGHSGLGGNLDIPSLEAKAGAFKFNSKKRQIFYFDSCSSYSYYLKPFAAQKTKAKIDVITNGLSSFFNLSPKTLNALMDALLDPKTADMDWLDLLKNMEKPLDGGSYLLSVGGV